MTPVERLFRDLIGVFGKLSIPYAVIGGLAVRARGLPRPTYDVDVAIAIDRGRLPELFGEIDSAGYDVPEQYHGGWVDQVAGMPLVKAKTFCDGRTVVADIFLAETDLLQSLMQRRTLEDLDGFKAWIVSAEDLVLLKLVAARNRDLGDVQDILLVQGQLDEAYLLHWAEKLGVTALLRKMLDEWK